MSELEIRMATYEDGVTCVALEGVLDGRTSRLLEKSLAGLLEEEAPRLAIDLQGVGLLTSAGSGVFLGSLVTAQERGGGVVLARPDPRARHVLELLGLDRVLVIVDGIEEARAHFRRSSEGRPVATV
jgi:anti-anti-sigma factor